MSPVDRDKLEEAYYEALMEGADLVAHDEIAEGRGALQRAVEHGQVLDGGTGRLSVEARLQLATLTAQEGDYAAALTALDDVVALANGLGEEARGLQGMALGSRAGVQAALDHYDAGIEDAQAAIALLEPRGDLGPFVEHLRSMIAQIEAERAATSGA